MVRRGGIEEAVNEAVLVINPLIYAEVSIGFSSVEDLEAALPIEAFRRDVLPMRPLSWPASGFWNIAEEAAVDIADA